MLAAAEGAAREKRERRGRSETRTAVAPNEEEGALMGEAGRPQSDSPNRDIFWTLI